MKVAFLCVILLAQNASGLQLAVTPVEKVITLLKALKMEIQGDGKLEARSYDQFACFCKDMTDTKSKSIIKGRDDIDGYSADIEAKTAEKADKSAELQERTVKQEEKTKELASAKDEYAKDKAAYIALAADLSKAISSLEKAIGALEAAKFVQLSATLRDQVQNSLALADAMNLKISGPKNQAVAAFLQVDPLDPSYKYRSGGIISTLQDLLSEFRAKKKDADDEWAKAEATHQATIKALEDFLSENKKAMDQLSADILRLAGEIAQARTDLVNAEATLKDDQLYLKDLTTRCEARANDWDQRSQMRNDELEALNGALTILQDNVTSPDSEVNERALFAQKSAGRAAVTFLQTDDVEQSSQVVKSHGKAKLTAQVRMDMVSTLLGGEGKRLKSTALSALAMRVAGDPFTKVKQLIQDLIERLLAESTAEATKKGFCDEELGKAKQDRDYRLQDANSLNNDLEQLEIKQDELEEEIKTLTADIDLLKKTLANATEERKQEHEDNMHTIEVAEEGLKAVNEATDILRSFYKQAAKAQALLQASPVDEDTDGPGFEGNYAGKQKASKGIIGMLETIITDFERTLRVTHAAEEKAHADFVLFDRASKADISGKEMKKELDEQDLATTTATIAQKMNDLQTAMDLLDAALKKLEDLKPTCIDTGMSYEERVAKREEEIEALKKALCILDEDGVEPACKGR